jgi:hypothetical protein
MSSPQPGENDAVPALLNLSDYSTFASVDADTFIAAAGDRIREYCGWHIYPSLTSTAICQLSGDGTILLPTLYLTSVVSLAPPWPDAPTIDASAYHFSTDGLISFNPMQYGYGPTPASANLWPIDTMRLFDAYPKHLRNMTVTFTHGYTQIPPTVAAVGYELAMRAMEKPAGVASSVTAGPYSYRFGEFGFVLSDDQKKRLSYYRLPGII